jgi:hypothetical protein
MTTATIGPRRLAQVTQAGRDACSEPFVKAWSPMSRRQAALSMADGAPAGTAEPCRPASSVG